MFQNVCSVKSIATKTVAPHEPFSTARLGGPFDGVAFLFHVNTTVKIFICQHCGCLYPAVDPPPAPPVRETPRKLTLKERLFGRTS